MRFAAGSPGTTGRTSHRLPFRILFCILITAMLVLTVPVSAASHILNPGDSIQQNITDAAPGDTILLNPGTYSERDILVSKNIIIQANPSRGGTAANTIIDAGSAGRIFNNIDGFSLTLDSLTLKNGKADDGLIGPIGGAGLAGMPGGAVFSTGPLAVVSSVFANCSAGNGGAGGPGDSLLAGGDGGHGGDGGAIYSTGTVTVTSSAFTSCSAGKGGVGGPGDAGLRGGNGGTGGYGGAVFTTGTVSIASSTFTAGTAGNGGTGASGGSATSGTGGNGGDGGMGGDGGAVVALGTAGITQSTFGSCSAGIGGNGGTGGTGPGGNGYAGVRGSGGSGGAIAAEGTASIASSAFNDCSGDSFGGAVAAFDSLSVTGSSFTNNAAGLGGAISAMGDSLTVASSTFTDCIAFEGGGAIASGFRGTTSTSITSSTFSRCFGSAYGGAVFSRAGTMTILSSTFSENLATIGGAVAQGITNEGGTLSVASSTFTDGLALEGGALVSMSSGSTMTITSSTITNCTALIYGGAILSLGNLTVTDSHITNCTADISGRFGTTAAFASATGHDTDPGITSLESTALPAMFTGPLESAGMMATAPGNSIATPAPVFPSMGGAIITATSNTTITRTFIANCSAAADGGGIVVFGGNLTMTSSSMTDCSSGNHGGAIFNSEGNVSVHFSRFYHNNGIAVWNDAASPVGTFDARNNWWGSNARPTPFIGPDISYEPWLLLNISSSPPIIVSDPNLVIRSGLTINSYGENTAGSGHVPDGITSLFAVRTGTGTLSPPSAGTVNGFAQTAVSSAAGNPDVDISGTVDDQTVFVTIPVLHPVATLGPDNSDDGPAAIVPGGSTPMTVTVNIGGDSKAWQGIVTGAGLRDLIVTGTVQAGPGDNRTAPPGTVFQYISLTPARFTGITNAVIYFTVPQSWLDEHHIAPGSIVLYHQTANGWEALPTTVVSAKDGTVYFSAQSTGFSLFAIVGTPTVLAPQVVAATPDMVSTPVLKHTPAPAPAVNAPVTTQTTTPPATASHPAAPSPLLNIMLVIAAIGILAGGGFMARRWWIRRQNPALFEDYD